LVVRARAGTLRSRAASALSTHEAVSSTLVRYCTPTLSERESLSLALLSRDLARERESYRVSLSLSLSLSESVSLYLAGTVAYFGTMFENVDEFQFFD